MISNTGGRISTVMLYLISALHVTCLAHIGKRICDSHLEFVSVSSSSSQIDWWSIYLFTYQLTFFQSSFSTLLCLIKQILTWKRQEMVPIDINVQYSIKYYLYFYLLPIFKKTWPERRECFPMLHSLFYICRFSS